MRLVIAFLFVVCSNGQSLGYDYASSCARPSRGGRAARAPCDLAARPYCNTPGEHYPWQAIRRFVRENQGLMRRMYGEERHIAVLKAEIENFVEDDDDDDGKPTDFAEDILKTQMMYTKKTHRGLRDKPHFRPVQNSEKNKKTDPDRLKVKPLNTTNVNTNLNATQTKTNETNTEKANKTEITNETANEDTGISYKTRLESIANIEINNLDPDVITLDAVIKQSIETNSIYPKYSTKEANADTEINTNTTETSSHNTMTLTTTTDLPIPSSTESITEEQYDDTTTEVSKDGWKPMTADSSTLPPTLLFSEHEKNKVDRIDMKTSNKKEEFHPKPLQHQESVRPAVIKLRGANACESKEEMAAPFWANSTRGEVLALLNMYPFEQYIHMESCVHERKQMYCREGCRCEQQYRLHRLLAYDPRNECRGIFADWFKFPGCCVCKCYDVPLEFRARSPRILHPQYDEEVKRIIYEDVARDWYSMSAYDNDIDDEDLF